MLGQLQNKYASDALSRVLKDVNEHPMVRHEAAEALGSIAGLLTFTYLLIWVTNYLFCQLTFIFVVVAVNR